MARRPRPSCADTREPGQLTQHSQGIAHIGELITHTVPPIHPAGLPFIVGPAALAAIGRKHAWIRRPAAGLALASAAFFRHPARVVPTVLDAVVAPADGEITLVDHATPPAELGLGTSELPRVSIFLSVFDIHVQRAPIAGAVTRAVHTPGKFLSADLPDASRDNERTSMAIHTDSGHDVGVVQIAGLIARRIVCTKKPGDRIDLGETYGLIRFGSRVDVYLPTGTQPTVLVGQRAVGAETVLATLPTTSDTAR